MRFQNIMAITTQSAKAKGRKVQQLVRDALLKLFPNLEPDDIKSTSMGVSGVDVQLSPAAKKYIPYSIECKARNKIGVYAMYDQAVKNGGKLEPLLVIKQDRSKPLVVVDMEHFLKLIKEHNGSSK